MDIEFSSRAFLALMSGLPITLCLAAASLFIGGLLSLLLVWGKIAGPWFLSVPANIFIFVFRGTPMIVQIFTIYYGAGQFRVELVGLGIWWFFREPFWCAVLALALNTAAYTAEIERGAYLSIPKGQFEAAHALGMNRWLLFRRIIAPLTLRQALPAYGNEVMLVIKSTSLASTITMMELTGIAHKLISQSFRAVEVFLIAGGIYLSIILAVTRLVVFIEHKITPHLRAARQ